MLTIFKKYRTRRLIQGIFFVLTSFVLIYYFLRYTLGLIERNKSNITHRVNKLRLNIYSESKLSYYRDKPYLFYTKQHYEIETTHLFQLGEILTSWNPDNTSPKGWLNSLAHPNNKKGIPRYDFSIPYERILALKRRELELPFIVYNVTDLDKTSNLWSYEYLKNQFGNNDRKVEASANNHFMYYSNKAVRQAASQSNFENWKPPQRDEFMKFQEFVSIASNENELSQADISGDRPLYYMTISAAEGYQLDFIREGLNIFNKNNEFFVVEPNEQNGINCRFGMKGVIAEAHYDAGRNFVAMVKGRKRYILLPPKACKDLHLLPRGHPSARHSMLDWSNMTEISQYESFMKAEATEVVVSMGDVLYIPSYWFHYIVSQDASIQCNTRSGNSGIGEEFIEECGFINSRSHKHDKIKKKDLEQLDTLNIESEKRYSRKRKNND